jgi:hypothetical protein
VEQYRLPLADGQPKVRVRFLMVGSDYWDWGFDYFGLYTKPAVVPELRITSTTLSAGNLTLNWNGTGANFSGLQKATSLNAPGWEDVPGTIGQTSYTTTVSGGPVFYRARKF